MKDLLAAPIASARMTLVWRLFGFVLVLLWVQNMGSRSAFEFADTSAASLDALAVCGLLLLGAGPTLLLLIGTATVGVWFLATIIGGQGAAPIFVADEYLIQAGVPVVAALVSAIHVGMWVRRRGLVVDASLRAEVDELNARVFRVFAVTTIALAGLHKLNTDFFGPRSCAALGQRLHEWWELPLQLPIAGPAGVVGLELLAALLLLVYPRLGVLAVICVMTALGHIGPAAFAATCVVMSLAFLDPGDLVLVRGVFARRWSVICALTLVVLATSFSVYRGPSAWLKFALLDALVVPAACLIIGVGLAVIRRRGRLTGRLTPAAIRWRRRPAKVMPGLSSWLALILLVNGLTPYLGLKYRFSTAMLSNLRADHQRWNSYVIPKWVRLRQTTPHVTVVWQPVGKWGVPRSKAKRQYNLQDGLYTRDALTEALEHAGRRRAHGRLSLTGGGQTLEFELPGDMLSARAWVEQQPASVFWQSYLGPGDRPQACVH